MGYGTIFEREKQFSKIRAANAATNVINHRMQKAMAGEKALIKKETVTHKIKTRYQNYLLSLYSFLYKYKLWDY